MRDVNQGSGDEEPTATQQSRAAIEAIAPALPANAIERVLDFDWIAPDGVRVTKRYTQAMLGMFPVQEFTTRISEVLELFMKGEFGIKVGELFRGEVEMPVNLDADQAQEFVDENEQLINAFIKAVQLLPDLQLDIMVLSLGVPRLERKWAKEQLAEPPHRGGLSVEEGFDLLIMFIRQNVPLLRRTVVGKARELFEVFRLEVLDQAPEEPESTPSSSPSTPQMEPTLASVPSPMEGEPTSPGGTPSSTSSPDTQAND